MHAGPQPFFPPLVRTQSPEDPGGPVEVVDHQTVRTGSEPTPQKLLFCSTSDRRPGRATRWRGGRRFRGELGAGGCSNSGRWRGLWGPGPEEGPGCAVLVVKTYYPQGGWPPARGAGPGTDPSAPSRREVLDLKPRARPRPSPWPTPAPTPRARSLPRHLTGARPWRKHPPLRARPRPKLRSAAERTREPDPDPTDLQRLLLLPVPGRACPNLRVAVRVLGNWLIGSGASALCGGGSFADAFV